MTRGVQVNIGDIFGRRTVVGPLQRRGANRAWLARCECGREDIVTLFQLQHTQTCRDCTYPKMGRMPAVGERFGRLVVTGYGQRLKMPNGNYKTMIETICDCGVRKLVSRSDLLRGSSTSCGCRAVEELVARSRSHGAFGTRLYNTWAHMIHRCSPKNNSPSAKYYSEKGIQVCSQWRESFEAFRDWALSHGYTDELTIERVDPDGHYEPANCEWITRSENSRRARAYHRAKRMAS